MRTPNRTVRNAAARPALAIASFIAILALVSCSNDPIFSAIEHEVKLKDPSILGTVSSMEASGGDLYAANGYIYRRIAGVGNWRKIDMPHGVGRCAKLASDGTNLYGLFTESDWTKFHSVQRYQAGSWSVVTGLDSVEEIGSGAGRVYAFVELAGGSNDHNYDVYVTAGTGSLSFAPTPVAQSIGIPTGTAGDYFATQSAVYRLSGATATPIPWTTLGRNPGGLCGVVVGSNGNVYTANYGNAYRWDGSAWTSHWLDLPNDPATGIAILQSATKNLLLVSCDMGYGEVKLGTAGELGSYVSPGSTSLSATDPADEDQYDSSVGLYHMSGIFAFTSPVPAADEYVIYASVQHYKYNGLWGYYDTTQTEWNRE
jgi:hypothetical protein